MYFISQARKPIASWSVHIGKTCQPKPDCSPTNPSRELRLHCLGIGLSESSERGELHGDGAPIKNSEERIWKGLSYHLIFSDLDPHSSLSSLLFFKPTSCFPSKLLQPQLQSSVLKGDPDEGWQGEADIVRHLRLVLARGLSDHETPGPAPLSGLWQGVGVGRSSPTYLCISIRLSVDGSMDFELQIGPGVERKEPLC